MSFFHSLTESLIDTSERIIKVVEEGSTILLGNQLSHDSQNAAGQGNSMPKGADVPTSTPTGGAEYADIDLDAMNDMDSPLNGIAEGVLDDIMKGQKGPQTIMEHIQAFHAAINWNEWFILGIISFHISMMFLTFIILKHGETKSRISLLIVISVLVQCASTFNTWASKNWESFATQNYFDENGVFVSLMWSTPLLLMTFIMLIAYLREASSLLIEVKRKEIQNKGKRKKNGGRIDPLTGQLIRDGDANASGSGSGSNTKAANPKKTTTKRRGKKSAKED